MKYKRFLATIAILTLISIHFYGQENYKPGYIITNNQDTLRGYILNVGTNHFRKCVFRKELKNKNEIYLPSQIQAYRYNDNGKYFVSKEISDQQKGKMYFVEYLVKGKASLLFMRDINEHFYVETETEKMVELTEPTQNIRDEYSVLIMNSKQYIEKLRHLLSDYPEISKDIENAKLYEHNLIKLIRKYNSHITSDTKYENFEEKVAPIRIKVGVAAGTSYNKFYFNPKNYTDYQFNGFVGINVELENALFSIERLNIKAGLYLQQFNTYNFYINEYSTDANTYYGNFFTSQMNFKSYSLINPITFNYSFPMNKFVPYIGAGISNMFILTQNNDLYMQDFKLYYGNVLPTYHLGVIGAIGLKYKIKNNHFLNLEFNYQNFNNLNMNSSLRMNTIYYSAQLGYLF
jgi:hypothetical protein